MPVPSDKKFEMLSFESADLPLCDRGTARVDLFLLLPKNEKFIRFVLQGDPVEGKHQTMLSRHTTPCLYARAEDFEEYCKDLEIPETPHNLDVLLLKENPEAFELKMQEQSQELEAPEELEEVAEETTKEESTESLVIDGPGDFDAPAEAAASSSKKEKENDKLVIDGAQEFDSSGIHDKKIIKGDDTGSVSVDEGSSKQSHLQKDDGDELSSRQSHMKPEEDYSGSRQSMIDPQAQEEASSKMQMQFGNDNAAFLKKAISKELADVYSSLNDESTAAINLEDSPIAELTEKLMDVVAPEVEGLRNHLKQIPEYVGVMDDSAAVTSIATLFCMAKGQTSRSIFREVSYACLFLDLSLAKFNERDWVNYYINPNSLNNELKKLVFAHPRASYQIIQAKFKNLPDIVGQMILGHHELFNGKGYPRKVRSELLAPLVRILAFAVDVFETMKRNYLKGKKVSLEQAVSSFVHAEVEPHQRRHNIVLMRDILEYLQNDEEP